MKTAILIDIAGMLGFAHSVDAQLDYIKLHKEYKKKYLNSPIHGYAAITATEDGKAFEELLDNYHRKQCKIFKRPGKSFENNGVVDNKINVSVDIAVAAMEFANNGFEHIILFSTDEELICLITKLQKRGIYVSVPLTAEIPTDLMLAANETISHYTDGVFNRENG